jgi:UrcA family protein
METIMSRSVKSALLAFAAIAAVSVPAAADPVMQSYSVRVAHADLDLGSEAGARTAIARIEQAAAQACGKRPAPRLIGATQTHRACLADVTLKAVETINAPVLTALYGRTTSVTVAAR